jgi:hypothetical protein
LVRGRFGTYEPIDFLALLIGYAVSSERTLADFFERAEPFESAFMALFGRRCLPHRSSLSRFLADVDRPCLEAFRALFEQHTFAEVVLQKEGRSCTLEPILLIKRNPLNGHFHPIQMASFPS